MSHWRLPVCLFLFASIFSASLRAQVRPAAGPAQIIVTNARIYTLNPRQSWAEALAIRDGKILAVGNAKEIGSLQGPATRVIDARGHLVLPGFTDCHIHFLEGSLALSRAELAGTHSVAEIQERLKKYAAAHPGHDWILGQGWTYEVFGEVALPDKKYLDDILPGRPVFLEGFDGHTTWANSKALQLAKISRETPDPPNGKIVRDPRTGEPTGALKEEASALVRNILPEPSREEKLAALRRGLVEANRAGLVRVHSAGGDFDSLDLYEELRSRGELTLRLYISDVVEPPELTNEEIAKLEKARDRYHDEWLAGGAVKFFLDGVVESHTAAMLEPYADDPNQIGKMFWDAEKYKQAVVELDRRGFQIFTHAIGDLAVRTALDAYDQAQKTNGAHDARDRIEHIETISAADIPRFGSLGVIASFQPMHALYPEADGVVWRRAAGAEREERGFAWQDVAKAEGRLAFGSDWPVVTLNPWIGVQTAVTRQTVSGDPPGGFHPEQRLTLVRAIEGYTLGAAVAGRREKTEGSLEPGKMADLILVSPNIFEADPHAIGKTKVLLTMIGGKIVYHAPGWPPSSKKPGGETKR